MLNGCVPLLLVFQNCNPILERDRHIPIWLNRLKSSITTEL